MAIAFDAESHVAASVTTSKTCNHTATGANSIIFGCAIVDTTGSDVISGMTWNGNAMTRLASYNPAGLFSAQRIYVYYYANGTADGASHACTATLTSNDIGMSVFSFTGASQTGIPDSNTTYVYTSQASPEVASTTVVTDQSFLGIYDFLFVGAITAGTNTTIIKNGDNNAAVMYSTAAVGTGSQSLTWTWSGLDSGAGIIWSFKPASSGPANVATWNGLALGSASNINGLAIGSIGSIDGLN